MNAHTPSLVHCAVKGLPMPPHTKPRKIVIVGMDGVSHSLLLHYMNSGVMPRFRQMCHEGRLFQLKSSLPEVSSVAWTSFMTGVAPGYHGIFGFVELNRSTYQLEFPGFQAVKWPPFWMRPPLRSIIFNLPQTYPAQPLNGVMVSGFVAVDLEKAVYPQRVYEYLKSVQYRLDVDSNLAVKDPNAFFADLFHVLEKRFHAARYLLASEPWDVFVAVITETDRLHHFYHDSAREGVYHHIFREVYRRLDSFLWDMYSKAKDDDALFVTCSDHGFESICSEVYVNAFLESLLFRVRLEAFSGAFGKNQGVLPGSLQGLYSRLLVIFPRRGS